MNPTKTMMIEVGTYNKLCEERQALREALEHAHTSLRTFSDAVPDDEKHWTTYDADVLATIENILTRTQEG